jgi:nicotinate phosphoribosyltransferase
LQHDVLRGEALMQPVIRGSMLLAPPPPLREIRAYAQSQLAALPASLRALTAAAPYPVAVSPALRDVARQADERQLSLADTDRAHWGDDPE